MVELHIKIRKRIARLAYGENFVSYNEGYKIIFDFDKEWDSIENKTARFIFGENYIDYPFNGNEVEIPLIKNADTLEIGVYSDGLYTTTPVKFKVLKSIKDEEKIEILVPEIYPEIEELDDEDLIKVYDKSEEKIGISPLKKLFDKTKVTIDDALAAAKASGEFDGADGITPTIGNNGNWFLGDTDTGKPSRGEKGDTGAQGIQGEKGDTGAAGATGADGKSAYSYAVDGGYTGTEAEFAAKLAAEKLPNPYPLTFTGAVSETYDGSSAKTITIPSGGGGALSGLAIADNYDIELISHVIIDQDNIPTAGITVTQKDDGSPFAYDGLLIWTDAKSAGSYTTFNFNGYTNYPIAMTHGDKVFLNLYITDGVTMSIVSGKDVRYIIKQSHADTGNLFYPDAVFQRVPEKFTSFKIGADGIASVKFYKAWGLTRK